MFAGSCIGAIALVVLLEFLRRLQREYDGFNKNRSVSKPLRVQSSPGCVTSDSGSNESQCEANTTKPTLHSRVASLGRPQTPRPNMTQLILRQLVRAFLHMCQFTVAYFIMLLAMYYNGWLS